MVLLRENGDNAKLIAGGARASGRCPGDSRECRMKPTSVREISVEVNETRFVRQVDVRETLGDFLRDDLGFSGVHLGCEHGGPLTTERVWKELQRRREEETQA